MCGSFKHRVFDNEKLTTCGKRMWSHLSAKNTNTGFGQTRMELTLKKLQYRRAGSEAYPSDVACTEAEYVNEHR